MRGSGCGSGWDGASSGRTELHVDATGGAQDWVGCHGCDKGYGLATHLYHHLTGLLDFQGF